MPNNDDILHVKHVKSNVVLNDGTPKLPEPNQLGYGEIAINYGKGVETISLRNSDNIITTFKPNTNVYVKNFTKPVTTEDICEVLSIGTVLKYQDFNISFLDAYGDNMDLFDIIDYIRQNLYDVCNLHLMLNIAKADDTDDNHTMFYVNTEALQEIIGVGETDLNTKSTIIGFYKYDEYFVAGDSNAMNGIEINWDVISKVMTLRFVYVDNAYRMDGNQI